MKSTTLTLRLPVEIRDRLDRLAETRRRTRSALACEAISRYLDLYPEASRATETCSIGLQTGSECFTESATPVDPDRPSAKSPLPLAG